MASLNHAKITNALDAIVAKCDKSSFFFDFLLAYGINICNKYQANGQIAASVAYKILTLQLFCSEFIPVANDLQEINQIFCNVDKICKKELGPDWLKIIAKDTKNNA